MGRKTFQQSTFWLQEMGFVTLNLDARKIRSPRTNFAEKYGPPQQNLDPHWTLWCTLYYCLQASVYKMALLSSSVISQLKAALHGRNRRQNNQKKTLFCTWLSAMLSIIHKDRKRAVRKRAQTLKIENGDVFVEKKGGFWPQRQSRWWLWIRVTQTPPLVTLDWQRHERELLNDSTGKEWWQMYKKL